MSRASRDKGARVERKLVKLHTDMGVPATKVSRMYQPGADVDVWPSWRAAALVCEVKGRANGGGFKTIEGWLGEDNDCLFLVRDRQEPLVVLPWRTWAEMVGGRDG